MTARRDDSILPISPVTSISEVAPVTAVRGVSNRRSRPLGDDSPHPDRDNDDPAENELSSFAQELSELAELAASDASRFVAVATAIAAELTLAANSATIDDQRVLLDVAGQFALATRDRNLSNFHPNTDVAIHEPSHDGAAHTGVGAYRSPQEYISANDVPAVIARIVRQALDANRTAP